MEKRCDQCSDSEPILISGIPKPPVVYCRVIRKNVSAGGFCQVGPKFSRRTTNASKK